MTDLAARRAEFAEELRALAGLRNDALVRAFARVPREAFLGPGPWRIVVPPRLGQYETSASADRRELCRDVLVAIDEARRLNNGQPSAVARGGAEQVRALRREPHARDAECWMHVAGFCLARRALR